ncbi:MAG: branched-chain amino acid ABC transporter permease [Deltaproteobacteria bacterium CG_4_8_14_3_um_filter_51_11]|nr:branched-chain amino acid ABC transporter permease [bacterium]NCP09170.1 branched-chain amino acid ABC transporter permease [bacterium]PIX18136.1 MAG: branched-chain amino acid ABC transporter permease [Deltaproteobacteria bacterium CG_4_8_14_3_um_filter_51_11]PIY27051.1 MAG: branched-chain amino acid ABC transporter permease [Deltaproteobacteria bacterium CG_4_10_14_3_um_filter_51_14]
MTSLAIMNGVVIGVIYALAALGVSLVVGIMNVINFAHGELYILAGYFSFLFADALGWNMYLSLAVAVFLVFLFGIFIEYILIRPTYGNEMYSLILTFILSIVLQNAYLLIFGPYPNKPPTWIKGATEVFGLFFYGNQRLAALVVGAFVITAVFLVIKLTWFGKIVRAASQDREMAELNGVNTLYLNMLSFGLGCALAGAAGVILAPVFPVTPTAGVQVALTAFVVVVLGGMGSLWGCVVGGLVLGLVENLGAAFLSTGYKHIFGFIILILVLLIRPAGLFGRKEI